MSDPASPTILDRIAEDAADHYRVLKISDLGGDDLVALSQFMKLQRPERLQHSRQLRYRKPARTRGDRFWRRRFFPYHQ